MVLIAGDQGGASARPVFGGIVAGALYTILGRGLRLWNETVFWSVCVAPQGVDRLRAVADVSRRRVPHRPAHRVGHARRRAARLDGADPVLRRPRRPRRLVRLARGHRRARRQGDLAPGGPLRRRRRRRGGRHGLARPRAAGDARLRSSVCCRACDGSAATQRTHRSRPPRRGRRRRHRTLLALGLWLLPWFHMRLADALLAVAFTFFFVVVSREIVGLIGTTSQPVSGMTITALLVTAFAILLSGRTGAEGAAAAIRVAAIVAVVDRARRRHEPRSEDGRARRRDARGCSRSARWSAPPSPRCAPAGCSSCSHKAYGIGSAVLPAPQAKLMATLAAGVMQGDLPWRLLALGAGLALVAEACGVASLPFAIGLYLPITTSAPLILGGLAAWRLHGPHLVGERSAARAGEGEPHRRESLTLLASGLVAGDALMGIGVAALVVSGLVRPRRAPLSGRRRLGGRRDDAAVPAPVRPSACRLHACRTSQGRFVSAAQRKAPGRCARGPSIFAWLMLTPSRRSKPGALSDP